MEESLTNVSKYRYGCLWQIKSVDVRRKKNAWKNVMKNRALSSRLPKDVEASP